MQETNSLKVNHVKTKEVVAFCFSAMFRDMSYALMAFLSYFYIDVMGLSGIALSLVMILSRLWDGVNDPIIGVYFDKSVSAEGKARPFFKRTAIPVAILIILIFFSPKFSDNPTVNMWLRAVYAFITYVFFEGLHTLNGTSFMSLYNSITPNVDEKNRIISVSRLFSNVGTGLVAGGIPIFLGFFSNDDILAKTWVYFGAGVFVGVCFLLYNWLMYRYVRERVLIVPEKKQSIKDMFGSFVKNKLLLIMIVSNSIAGLINAGNTVMWFFTYNMGNSALMTYTYLAGVPFLVLGTIMVPYLTKKYEKNTLVIALSVFQVLLNVVYMMLGYSSIVVVFAITMLGLYPLGAKNALYWSMISDSIDYLEWKTGDRNDGMVFAIEGFLGKVIGSIGAVSTVIIVAVTGYVPNALTQSESTMQGLFYLPLIIGIISTALSTVPYFFYRFTRSDHETAQLDIAGRRKPVAAEAAEN